MLTHTEAELQLKRDSIENMEPQYWVEYFKHYLSGNISNCLEQIRIYLAAAMLPEQRKALECMFIALWVPKPKTDDHLLDLTRSYQRIQDYSRRIKEKPPLKIEPLEYPKHVPVFPEKHLKESIDIPNHMRWLLDVFEIDGV